MTDLLPPPVPELSDHWIAARRDHLISELSVHHRRRPTKPIAWSIGGALAASVAATVVGVVGIGSTPAFAGWTSSPTPPASGQTAAAQSACQARLSENSAQATKPGGAGLSDATPSIVDTRGPFTLMVLAADNAAVLCISDSTFTSVTPVPTNLASASQGTIALARVAFTSRNGQSYTLAEGEVGSDVSGTTLVLDDGSQVVSTVTGGDFLAWWPSNEGIASAQVATSTGTTTQQLGVAGPSGATTKPAH